MVKSCAFERLFMPFCIDYFANVELTMAKGNNCMCGITGILSINGESAPSRNVLERMTEALERRGPDDAGIYMDGPLGLGFRRMSIIDLSQAGHQPMSNEDGSVWLVCNGEIYNFVGLREELCRKEHVFKSETDIETILHGYEEWKEEVLARLEGMFAFALWDARQRKLLLARDQFGIKPLHYAVLPNTLVFGSEIKAILAEPSVPRDLNDHAIWNYLTFAQVPAPETIYRAIKKLLPGHSLTCHRGEISINRYYELPKERHVQGDPEELGVELRRRLDIAIQTHLVADVPVGCFLSGGLDSSLITALAVRHYPSRMQTFSVAFQDQPQLDESLYQNIVSAALGTEHHVLSVQPNLVELVREIASVTDEPFAISSFIPLYCMVRMTRDYVKVVMSGDGSDELFAGYTDRYRDIVRNLWLGRLARPFIGRLKQGEWIWRNRILGGKLWWWSNFAAYGELEQYVSLHPWFTNPEKSILLQPDVMAAIASEYGDYIEEAYNGGLPNTFERRLRYEMLTIMPDEMMVKLDRACSAFGIEGRVPYLDRQVVEYAWSINPSVHLKNGIGKSVLKAAARGLLPDLIIDRPKQGFMAPVNHWLRTDTGVRRLLLHESNAAFDEWIRPEVVRSLLRAHDAGVGDLGERLWVLFVLKIWMMRQREGV
jgi:asparagine synthase (glutamine-hydrolysing)